MTSALTGRPIMRGDRPRRPRARKRPRPMNHAITPSTIPTASPLNKNLSTASGPHVECGRDARREQVRATQRRLRGENTARPRASNSVDNVYVCRHARSALKAELTPSAQSGGATRRSAASLRLDPDVAKRAAHS
jgi:hypothetical protein